MSWSDLEPACRGLPHIADDFAAVPATHIQQVRRISDESLAGMQEWLRARLPVSRSRDQLGYPESHILRLDDDSWNTEAGSRSVRQWLHDRGVRYGTTVYLFYDDPLILSMPWRILVRYWNAWAWSVGYSMTAVDSTCQWACMFHHENVIEFGQFTKDKTEQSLAAESR
jgi:hypothetical protein